MKIPAALKGEAALWGGLLVGGGLLLWLFIKKGPAIVQAGAHAATSAAAGAAQGAISGLDNNSLTNTGGLPAGSGGSPDSQGFGGDLNYNYSGFGLLSSPAAVANKATGGGLAAIGEWLGGLFAPSYDPNAPATPTTASSTGASTQAANRDQVVGSNYVTDLGQLLDQTGGGG